MLITIERGTDMIIDVKTVDHIFWDEKNNQATLLIIDLNEFWTIETSGGLFRKKDRKRAEEKKLEHLVCLKCKVEYYVTFIINNGIKNSFPEIDDPNLIDFDIRIISDFEPDSDYVRLIDSLNSDISSHWKNIHITNEVREK